MKSLQHVFLLILLLSSTTLLSQNPELETQNSKLETQNPELKTLPQWATMMYAGEDIAIIKSAFEAYYKTNPFEKNAHTQAYKRMMRELSRDRFHPELTDPMLRKQVDEAYLRRANAVNSSRAANSPWQSLGPFDFDINAAGRSYAPGAAHVYTVEQAISNTNVLYAGTATAGVWKSLDKGMTWTLLTRDMMVNSVSCFGDQSSEHTDGLFWRKWRSI